MWQYQQSTGNLTSPSGEVIGQGYSGFPPHVNNPIAEALEGLGPTPTGMWTIGAFFEDMGGKGPIVAHLTPCVGTDALGRDGFMIHGDNGAANHTASHGCIILARPYRIAIRDSGDTTLLVTQ
jgi:hypothetical protein